MYYAIGRDEAQYGPVDADGIRQWIRERRLNGTSRVRADGTEQWTPLSEIPEFADALRQAETAPPVTPTPPSPRVDRAQVIADETLARTPDVHIGACISRGFDLVMDNFGVIVGATVLVGLVMMVPVIGWVLTGPLVGGLCSLMLQRMRGREAAVGDAFSGFGPLFGQLFLVRLLTGILISVGFLLCLLPGIYLAVAWAFAIPLVADRNLDFWTAMEVSRKVITRHWWAMFGLVLLAWLIGVAGVLACFVGIVVTAPIGVAAVLYAYEDMFGQGPVGALVPAPVVTTTPTPTPGEA